MIAHHREESLKGHTIVKILAGVDLEANVNANTIKRIQDRLPASAELAKAFGDDPSRPLRPRVHEVPHQGTGERHMTRQTQIVTCLDSQQHLIDRPLLPSARITPHFARRKAIEHLVIRGVGGDQLTLKVGRELRDLEPMLL